jgi:hypothetical protein
MELEQGDIQPLLAAGWRMPEVFTTLGRDGKTEIWGVINRPMNFGTRPKYPVIESIYARPQGSFVPKTFSAGAQPLTAPRFHRSSDRWNGNQQPIESVSRCRLQEPGRRRLRGSFVAQGKVAAKYPYYDISRVGIFELQPEGRMPWEHCFSTPSFIRSRRLKPGCHDNRMDKIWWNEQWMSWPRGPSPALIKRR